MSTNGSCSTHTSVRSFHSPLTTTPRRVCNRSLDPIDVPPNVLSPSLRFLHLERRDYFFCVGVRCEVWDSYRTDGVFDGREPKSLLRVGVSIPPSVWNDRHVRYKRPTSPRSMSTRRRCGLSGNGIEGESEISDVSGMRKVESDATMQTVWSRVVLHGGMSRERQRGSYQNVFDARSCGARGI